MLSDPLNLFDITDRQATAFGVPSVRSGSAYGQHKVTALDIMPRGAPSAHDSGKAWIDVCSADLIANPLAAVRCAYLGVYDDMAVVGARAFNGVSSPPLYVRVGNKLVARFTEAGLEVFGTITRNGVPIDLPDEGEEPPPVDGVFTGSDVEMLPPFCPGAGDFTISVALKGVQTTRADILTMDGVYTATGWWGLLLNVGGSGRIAWYEKSTMRMSAVAPWNDGAQHVITIRRVGGALTMLLDGTTIAAAQSSFAYGAAAVNVRLGLPAYDGTSLGFVGEASAQLA